MSKDFVSDRVWLDHYYVCADWRDKPMWSHIEVVQNGSKLTGPKIGVMEAAHYDRRPCDKGAKWIATELYIFYKDGKYTDAYATHMVYFNREDRDLDYLDKLALVRKTKIQVSKGGKVTVTPYNADPNTYQVPVPSKDRCGKYADQLMWEAGW